MGRSQETFNKKEKKRKEKEQKRLARRENEKKGSLDDMIAYVDENGNITSTPPDPGKKKSATKLEDIEVSVPRREKDEDANTERKGVVSYFNESKGYGFIRDSETKESIFVHVENILEEIKEGNMVSFEKVKGHKGPTAIKVKLFKE